ncbi:hypothetical protein RHECNPAF_1340048 [Rhizobium etli CNPAF512]|nr:hypothetical protein RHECNPAF_1340048 [Rhizobium etli CNPAF512]
MITSSCLAHGSTPINATRMYAFNIVTLRGNNQSICQNAADFRRLATGSRRRPEYHRRVASPQAA